MGYEGDGFRILLEDEGGLREEVGLGWARSGF